MSRTRQLVTYATLIVLSACIWIFSSLFGLLDGVEQEALRWRYLVRGEMPSKAPIKFVNVDPLTVAKMGDKPWDRQNFARTVHALFGPGKARAVGIDIVFSPMGTGSLLDVDEAKKGDQRFGDAVEQNADRLILAAAYTGTTNKLKGVLPLRRYDYHDPAEVPFPETPTFPIVKYDYRRFGIANVDEALNKGQVPYKVPAIFESEGQDFSLHLIDGMRRFSSLKGLEMRSEGGLLKLVDSDGFPLDPIPAFSSHRLLTFGLQVFLAANGLSSSDLVWEDDSLLILKDGEVFREVPLILGQSMVVNWLEGWDIKRRGLHYSMAEVLDSADALRAAAVRGDATEVSKWEAWFQQFEGKVIFIGATDATLKDLAPTPYNQLPVPKVGLHANVYRMIEEEAYITELDASASSLIIALLSTVVAVLLLWSGRWRIYIRSVAVILFFGYAGLVFLSFSGAGLILPLIGPMAASVSSAFLVILCKLGSEEYQRRRIKNLFGSYVSPSLVDEMVESERDPELGGVEVQVTALFSDVEGFSALSEELRPNDLVSLMNEYLGAMTETFQQEQGTLDKYIGDAIVTMFGMPYPVEDHAARACRSAIRMQNRHAELRQIWAAEGKWPQGVLNMRTRIGINTGEAVIGNMGSEMRFNYTMMGDSVNLAARCESGAKSYGVYTMVTADTLNAALAHGEELNYRKLDRIVVKGRSQPVEIYELWDGTVDVALVESCRRTYQQALEHYFKGDWESALRGFESSVLCEPARAYAPTTPSEVLVARCREFLEHGPPENWDGAYRMQSK